MPWWKRPERVIGTVSPPPGTKPGDVPAAALPELARGEQVLATAQEDTHGHWLVLTTWRLLERGEDGRTVLERPWHEVDTGSWDPDAWTLSVLFVGPAGEAEERRWQLRLRTGPGSVPVVFRDRTTASVVLTRVIDLGPRRTARVTIRTVLATRELVEQVLLGHGSRVDDAELSARVLSARRELRDQVGMDPEPPLEVRGAR